MYIKILAGMLFLHLQAGSALARPGYAGAEVPGLGSMQSPGEIIARKAVPGEAREKYTHFTPRENAGVTENDPGSLEAFLSMIGPKPDTVPETDADSSDDPDTSSDSSKADSEAEFHG